MLLRLAQLLALAAAAPVAENQPFWSRTPIPKTLSDAVLAANAGSSNGVVITFINNASTPLWLAHQYQMAKDQGLDAFLSRLVVVTWDTPSYDACKALPMVHCAYDTELLDGNLKRLGLDADDLSSEVGYHDQGGAHHIYARMCWRKVEVVAHSLSLNVPTMLVDADVLVFADPSVAFDRHEEDVRAVIWGGGESYSSECARPDCSVSQRSLNSGTYLAQPTQGVKETFAKMLDRSRRLDLDAFDQDVYAAELAAATSSGKITSVIVEPALMQGDCRDVEDYCRVSPSVQSCSICDKVSIHASACGDFASKGEHMANFRKAYEEACGTREEQDRSQNVAANLVPVHTHTHAASMRAKTVRSLARAKTALRAFHFPSARQILDAAADSVLPHNVLAP